MTRTSDAPAGAAAPSAQTAARLALRGVDGRLTRAGRLALVVVCVAVFLTALDQTVVLTVLPAMIADIGVPVAQLDHAAWIVSGYLLGYVVVMPLMGRIADIYGRWRVFALCLTLFGLGSLLCALAPRLGSPIAPDFTTLSGALLTPLYRGAQALLPLLARLGIDVSAPGLVVLVAARFVQAVGGGAVVPVAMAVAGDLFGQTRRGLALGLVGAVTEAGGVVGPLWGALITRALGWPWISTSTCRWWRCCSPPDSGRCRDGVARASRWTCSARCSSARRSLASPLASARRPASPPSPPRRRSRSIRAC